MRTGLEVYPVCRRGILALYLLEFVPEPKRRELRALAYRGHAHRTLAGGAMVDRYLIESF